MSTNASSRRSRWHRTYEEVRAIAEALGRTPRLSDGVQPALVNWLAGQRRATTLSDEQKRALEAIPGWSWNPRDDAWLARAEELRMFIAANGRLPRERESTESALAHWLSRQRVMRGHGLISTDRIRTLDYVLRALDM